MPHASATRHRARSAFPGLVPVLARTPKAGLAFLLGVLHGAVSLASQSRVTRINSAIPA